MKKIYQIIFSLLLLFFIVEQENLAFGQNEIVKMLEGKIATCGLVSAVSNQKDSTNQIVKDTTKTTRIVMSCQGSFNGNSQPWYIIDGVPQENDSLVLIKISPEDIESISVMKGAAATALYGSRGVNGVVLITLKKEEIKEEKIEKSVEEIKINIFPNPTSDFVNIALHLKEKSEVEIKIYNLQTLESHEVSKEIYEAGEQKINWKVDLLQKGTYNIKIKIGNQIIDRKIVIQN